MSSDRKPRKADSDPVTVDVNVQDVRANWADAINRVHYRRERLRILRFGKPVAVLVPVDDAA